MIIKKCIICGCKFKAKNNKPRGQKTCGMICLSKFRNKQYPKEKRCKGFINNGSPCRLLGEWNGYCVLHYKKAKGLEIKKKFIKWMDEEK